MDLIHYAKPTEIVVALDARYDLGRFGQLLPELGPDGEVFQANRKENERRVDVLDAAVRDALRKIAQERHLTIYVGDDTEVTNTPDVDPYNGYPLEYSVLQEAHDRAYEFIPEGQGW